jgi:hypothetical protein
MDIGLVIAVEAQKAAALQQQIATSALKTNLDAQKSNVLTLLGSAQQSLSSPISTQALAVASIFQPRTPPPPGRAQP